MNERHIKTLRRITSLKIITAPQLVLLLLANKRLAGWRPSAVTEATGMTKSTFSMAKKALLAQELIVEHIPQRDRRMSKIYLTHKGRRRAGEMWRLLNALCKGEGDIRASSD